MVVPRGLPPAIVVPRPAGINGRLTNPRQRSEWETVMPSDRPPAAGRCLPPPTRTPLMSRYLFNARAASLLALSVLMAGVAARADVIVLKDGFTIHAVKTVKEKDVAIDE